MEDVRWYRSEEDVETRDDEQTREFSSDEDEVPFEIPRD